MQSGAVLPRKIGPLAGAGDVPLDDVPSLALELGLQVLAKPFDFIPEQPEDRPPWLSTKTL